MHSMFTASPALPASKCTFDGKEQRGTLSGSESEADAGERRRERKHTLWGKRAVPRGITTEGGGAREDRQNYSPA